MRRGYLSNKLIQKKDQGVIIIHPKNSLNTSTKKIKLQTEVWDSLPIIYISRLVNLYELVQIISSPAFRICVASMVRSIQKDRIAVENVQRRATKLVKSICHTERDFK